MLSREDKVCHPPQPCHVFVAYHHARKKFRHRKKDGVQISQLPSGIVRTPANKDKGYGSQHSNTRTSEPRKGRYFSPNFDFGNSTLEREEIADSIDAEKQTHDQDKKGKSYLDMFARDLYELVLINREESEIEDLVAQVPKRVQFLLERVGDKYSRMKFISPSGNVSVPALKLSHVCDKGDESQHSSMHTSEPCKGQYISPNFDSGKCILETEEKADSTYAEKQTQPTIMCLEDSLKSSDQGKSHLDMFALDLYELALMNRVELEIEDLVAQVTKLVQFLLEVVGSKDSRLKYLELVPTGSVYDGTKVLLPDEFDYLAVLEGACGKNMFVVERECKDNDGFAHVKLVDREMCKKWQFLSSEGKLISVDMNKGVCSFREQFRILFHEAVDENIDLKLNSSSGCLVLLGFSVSINGPECTVEAQWIPRNVDKLAAIDVSIDVCPALKSDQIKIISREDVPSKQVWRVLNSSDSFYLIPKPAKHCSHCFKLVFAKQDQDLVKNLSETHRQCLLVLKYLAKMVCDKYFCTKVSLNSYTMKTVLMHHSFGCHSDESISNCIQRVLTRYQKAVARETPCCPSVFILKRNILRTLSRCDETAAQISANVVRHILTLFEELKGKSLTGEYDFGKCFQQLQQKISLASSNRKT